MLRFSLQVDLIYQGRSQARGRACRTSQFAQGELTNPHRSLPVWQKTFLKVMTVWHNSVRSLNLLHRPLPHFIAPDPLLKPADRAC